MIKSVYKLIGSFDDDIGLSGDAYHATLGLIDALWGKREADVFARYVKAVDGRFYIKSGQVQNCLKEITFFTEGK